MRTCLGLIAVVLLINCGGKKGDDKPPGASKLAGLHASADTALDELVQLESKKDVTCWTSFRQLDWFIAEKTYSEFGTLAKIAAMKALVRATWEKASTAAKGGAVTDADIKAAVTLPDVKLSGQVQSKLSTFANDIGLKNFTDYQKTAEHVRMVLAVIQDEMYSTGGNPTLKPLDPSGVRQLTDAATTMSLMMLKESGKQAETAGSLTIDGPHVTAAHTAIATQLGLKNTPHALQPLPAGELAEHLQPITKKLIDAKVTALIEFNKGPRDPLANLNKVTRIPITEDGLTVMMRQAQSFVHFVARGFEPMQADNFLDDGSYAATQMPVRGYIDEIYAQNVVLQLFPHTITANGDVDVKFEVNPGPVSDKPLKGFSLKLLDHEQNGIRDSALHWIALQNVWKERAFAMDPFAAEYVSEVVSMMLTLWIKRGEAIAAEMGKKQIDAEVAKKIQNRSFKQVQPEEPAPAAWTDARKKTKETVIASAPKELFKDTSKTAGLPTKFATWNVDLDSIKAHVEPDLKGQPGHVEPNKDLKNQPGHVEPNKDLKNQPGHVEPNKDLKNQPGHVGPDKDLKKQPGHVEPDKDLKKQPGHVEPDKDLKKQPGHVEPDKDLKKQPGHVEPDKDLKKQPGHVEPDKDLKKQPGHVEPDKDLKKQPGHVEPDKDLKKQPGHVEPDKDLKKQPGHVGPDTKGMPGHVEPSKDLKKQPGHVEPDTTSVQGHFNLQTIMGGGVAVGDLNGDDYPDLYLTGEELGKLYLNKGRAAPGTFTDATAAWGLPEIKDGHGTLFFDLDGDADLDLLVLRSEHPSALFRNDKGKFVDVHEQYNFVTHRGGHVAHVFDYDKDGDLDIYVGYYGSHAANMNPGKERSVPSLDGRNGSPNQLWRNDGTKLVETAQQAKVDDIGWCLAVSSFDKDFDGDLDLFLANDFGADVFYENNGDGTFKDITEATRTGDRGSGMNVDFGDVNGDGQWDIYITNIDMFSKNIKVIFPRDESTVNIDEQLTRAFQYINGNKLYVADGKGNYRAEETLRMEPRDRGWGWDAAFFDYENDGDDDLYITNGWINGSYAGNQKNQMYLNHDGFLYMAPESSPEAFPGNTRSAAPVDLDLDGDIDLVVNQFRQPPRILINQQKSGNNFVQLELTGKGKNPFALGATIKITAGGKTILRQVSGGRGYLGQADTLVTAGLGKATTADVEIRWPDGSTSKHPGLAVNKRHAIKEP